MKYSPTTTAVVVACTACGLVRVADDYSAAHARGKAHTTLSGHHAVTYSQVEAPERLRLAQAVEQRSRRAIKGYVEDTCGESFGAVLSDSGERIGIEPMAFV